MSGKNFQSGKSSYILFRRGETWLLYTTDSAFPACPVGSKQHALDLINSTSLFSIETKLKMKAVSIMVEIGPDDFRVTDIGIYSVVRDFNKPGMFTFEEILPPECVLEDAMNDLYFKDWKKS